MASSFPGGIDNFVDPLIGSPLNSPSHALQHQNVNDAVEKIETYMGLVKVVPTSAVNGTVGATGTVTVGTAVSSVTVNGAFSALYDNYRILYSGGIGSALISLTFKLGASVTGYYGITNYANYSAATTPLAAGDNNTSVLNSVGYASTSFTQCTFDVLAPNLARWTTISNCSWSAGTVAGNTNGVHQVATSYSDFTIGVNTGNITGGNIRIYGYRN